MGPFSRWAVSAVLFFIPHLHADAPSKQHLAIKLCEHLLTAEVTPQGFDNNPIFEEVAPGIHQVIGSENYEAEIDSLKLLIERFGGEALAIGNFAHMKGLAAIDAVWFPPGEEPINLSIKSVIKAKSTNGMNGFRKHAADAEASILKHLSREAFAESLGLEINAAGELRAPPGTGHQLYRMRTIEAVFRILGLDQSERRRAGILMDNVHEVHQSVTFLRTDVDPERGREQDDILLRILDNRVDESSIKFPATMNMSKIVRRMREGGAVQKFIALFKDSSVIVEANGIKTISK